MRCSAVATLTLFKIASLSCTSASTVSASAALESWLLSAPQRLASTAAGRPPQSSTGSRDATGAAAGEVPLLERVTGRSAGWFVCGCCALCFIVGPLARASLIG